MLIAEKYDCASDGARKPVLDRAAQDEQRVRLEAERELAVAGVAEVAVVLVAPGQPEAEPSAARRLRGRAYAAKLLRPVSTSLDGRKPGKTCAPARRDPPNWFGNAAVDVGVRFAGDDLVGLAAELGAERDVERAGQAGVDLPRDIEVGQELVEPQRAGVELALVCRSARARR